MSMADIKLLKAVGGKAAGEVLRLGVGQADHLVERGYAERVEEAPPKKKASRKRPANSQGGGDSPTEPPATAG